MIARPVARAVAQAVARPVTGRAFAAPPEPGTERVQNGDFASATGWTTATWTIAFDVATNDTPGPITNTLINSLSGGEGFLFSIDIVANPLNSGLIVRLVNSGGTPAPQELYNMLPPLGTVTVPGSVGGAYDQLVIISADDAGMIIDNVSLIA